MLAKRKAERGAWEEAFKTMGIGLSTMLKMSETEFQNNKDYLTSIGVTPENQPEPVDEAKAQQEIIERLKQRIREQKEKGEVTKSPSVQLMEEQDAEYQQLLKSQLEKEAKEKQDSLAQDLESQPTDKDNKVLSNSGRIEAMMKRYELVPEPESGGVQISIKFPNGKSYVRSFDPERPGSDVLSWASVLDESFDPNGEPLSIRLVQPFGNDLDMHKTIFEQGIKRKTAFNVMIN